ncbi:MAG: hypothetical protein CXZ00_13060 [Acidobacteria bacterium]|nr:MAG: hypothetical protein CXZ00_13060 [Acidobacteriota bacterium]
MSIRHITAVFQYPHYRGSERLVLLALADYANDAGVCFPSVKALAAKVRLGVRQTHKVLSTLRRDGAISVESGSGRHIVNRYRLNPDKFTVNRNSLNPATLNSDVQFTGVFCSTVTAEAE